MKAKYQKGGRKAERVQNRKDAKANRKKFKKNLKPCSKNVTHQNVSLYIIIDNYSLYFIHRYIYFC